MHDRFNIHGIIFNMHDIPIQSIKPYMIPITIKWVLTRVSIGCQFVRSPKTAVNKGEATTEMRFAKVRGADV